jgi:hypothetical protein
VRNYSIRATTSLLLVINVKKKDKNTDSFFFLIDKLNTSSIRLFFFFFERNRLLRHSIHVENCRTKISACKRSVYNLGGHRATPFPYYPVKPDLLMSNLAALSLYVPHFPISEGS